jgi:ferredoxin
MAADKATICFYTGTGNSLWIARMLAEHLGGARLVSMALTAGRTGALDAPAIGLVFPVYIWGVPGPVIRFVRSMEASASSYYFAVAVNAGQVSNTLVQLKDLMTDMGLALSAGFQVKMPSNYIPWGGPGPRAERDRRFARARDKVARIGEHARNRDILPVEKGPLWQRILFTACYRMTFARVPAMDAPFRADERCNSCGICVRVCPCMNVTLADGKPTWSHRCEQCFACLQWCPQAAIQYGSRTAGYERYHHPEILLSDIMHSRRPCGSEGS